MVNPCPGYSITTSYWEAGPSWGCGRHDGVDYAAPSGADVVSVWGGTVTEAAYPTSFGSAFGRAVVIDHDVLPDGSPGGWGLYAHLSAENVTVGQRVTAGLKIGDVGTTGNSSGNHLHFGVYMQNGWSSCGGADPQRWIDAGVGAAPPVPPSEPEIEWLLEGVLEMSAHTIVFFNDGNGVWEANLLTGTRRAFGSEQALADRRYVLEQAGVPYLNWPEGTPGNPDAFGIPV